MIKSEEDIEALESLCNHYGMKVLLLEIDGIVERVTDEIMTIPLKDDPEKASLQLYAARMKGEGAQATRTCIRSMIDQIKSRGKMV